MTRSNIPALLAVVHASQHYMQTEQTDHDPMIEPGKEFDTARCPGVEGLIAAVVRKAVHDRESRSAAIRAEAESFFTDGRLACWLDGTGLATDSVNRLMR